MSTTVTITSKGILTIKNSNMRYDKLFDIHNLIEQVMKNDRLRDYHYKSLYDVLPLDIVSYPLVVHFLHEFLVFYKANYNMCTNPTTTISITYEV